MTMDELAKKYADLPVDEDRIEKNFRHMGRFGRTTIYGLSFETENSTVTAEKRQVRWVQSRKGAPGRRMGLRYGRALSG